MKELFGLDLRSNDWNFRTSSRDVGGRWRKISNFDTEINEAEVPTDLKIRFYRIRDAILKELQ
jgi:hypothetical protein